MDMQRLEARIEGVGCRGYRGTQSAYVPHSQEQSRESPRPFSHITGATGSPSDGISSNALAGCSEPAGIYTRQNSKQAMHAYPKPEWKTLPQIDTNITPMFHYVTQVSISFSMFFAIGVSTIGAMSPNPSYEL